jgi:3',5'-cyclic AMP phosphodiesterase CpdA
MVQPAPPAQVAWVFARDDESIARELLGLASVLELQGLIKNWSSLDVPAGQEPATAVLAAVRSADIVMLLLSSSTNYLVDPAQVIAQAKGRARVVPVAVRPISNLFGLSPLAVSPRDGSPILGRTHRKEALLEVIRALQDTATFRDLGLDPAAVLATGSPPAVVPASRTDRPAARGTGGITEPVWSPGIGSPAAGPDRPVMAIDDIFRLNGPPTVTFVEPPGFAELKLALRNLGTGLILEGPSKAGKSTAIRKAMTALGVAEADQRWEYGQAMPPVAEFQRMLDGLRRATRKTWLFIDDFHYVEDEAYRRPLAACMKLLADQPTSFAKITLIGINPLGSSLVQVMPDLAGRFRIQRLDVDKDRRGSAKIAELIILGEQAANVRFRRRDEFVVAAGGSLFLAQWLCNRAAFVAGVEETQGSLTEIEIGPADVVERIQGELAARFRAPLLQFAAFDEPPPPPRGAALSLLWLLTRSPDGFVAVKEVRLRFPMLGKSLDWFLSSNLSRCFKDHPQLQGLLYYNPATATLTLEDPQLKFYLRELDWEQFAEASGHGHVTFHPEDGPLWLPPITASGHATGEPGHSDGRVVVSPPARRLLHLSDLHFATHDQATIFYAQLAADLRQQGIADRLDALVVSGDLVNRAEPREYDAARFFLEQLMSGFNLAPHQVVLVPGNHDVSWDLSKAAYTFHRRADYRTPLGEGTFIAHGTEAIEVRNDALYRDRFQPFADLCKAITGTPYPLAPVDQATLHDLDDGRLLVLGLNSAWEIDHHFRDRASIHAGALAQALVKLGPPSAEQLRLAVFHHPIHSPEESRIKDAAFLQQLAVAGFRVVLHGHVHKADASLYRYDRSVGGRQLEIVAAGTFGANTRDWVPGYPLQYNLLLISPEQITVETRKREEVNGAWSPDARWLQGSGQDPLPRYTITR